jgi:DNA replication protein DnaC
MAMNQDITEILNFATQRGLFNHFTRYQYTDYDINRALEVVEALGKRRDSKFVIDNDNRFTYENFIKWCHCDETMKALNPDTGEIVKGNRKGGIYIGGNTGTGKSWCLDLMMEYCTIYRFKIVFNGYEATEATLNWRSVRADDITDYFCKQGNITDFKARQILGIQDLGCEPQEVLYMGNRFDVLRQLIEFRGDKTDEITLITSNMKLGGQNLVNRYGDRVASRLHQMCNYFEIKGKDRRKL